MTKIKKLAVATALMAAMSSGFAASFFIVAPITNGGSGATTPTTPSGPANTEKFIALVRSVGGWTSPWSNNRGPGFGRLFDPTPVFPMTYVAGRETNAYFGGEMYDADPWYKPPMEAPTMYSWSLQYVGVTNGEADCAKIATDLVSLNATYTFSALPNGPTGGNTCRVRGNAISPQ